MVVSGLVIQSTIVHVVFSTTMGGILPMICLWILWMVGECCCSNSSGKIMMNYHDNGHASPSPCGRQIPIKRHILVSYSIVSNHLPENTQKGDNLGKSWPSDKLQKNPHLWICIRLEPSQRMICLDDHNDCTCFSLFCSNNSNYIKPSETLNISISIIMKMQYININDITSVYISSSILYRIFRCPRRIYKLTKKASKRGSSTLSWKIVPHSRPLPLMNGVMGPPINGRKSMVNWDYKNLEVELPYL